ncbi:hypothetical protein [Allocoleopsis franciscana]|uniref:Uncharacterized protein n=1 Tax=Allocoleopsis franciscana PCC 7113 TaxID=1173027 RepID=K9WM97_9CYAN|nr:hypothetical protein [Allocoleopsis franciscana]AFZ20931.1 hypothetical protein Mic7113_5282 [Allocoleopsis franciscana PCC 7113]
MKKHLSCIALAIAFGISPHFAYAQTHSHLTDEELQKLMPDFQRQVDYWNQYEEPQRQSEAKAFAENWSRRDPTVAPFLGTWAGWEQTMDIYPSTTEGQVCIIYTDDTAQVVSFALGNVLNQRIYDGSGVTFRQGNYLASAWNNNNPTNEAGVEAYRLIAPAKVPTRAYWRDWDESDRVIEQFNAASCIAEASNEALEQRNSTATQSPTAQADNLSISTTDLLQKSMDAYRLKSEAIQTSPACAGFRTVRVGRLRFWTRDYQSPGIFARGLTSLPPSITREADSKTSIVQITEIADSTSEAANPFELMQSEGFGELKLDLTASQVLEILGIPETKGEIVRWGADGLYHQDWYYPQQGITLNMASETPGERQTVFNITLTSPSTLKTQRGIRIGDSYTEVMQAYKDEEDREMSIPYESFIAGSIYGGLIFSFQDSIVNQIFLGAAAE